MTPVFDHKKPGSRVCSAPLHAALRAGRAEAFILDREEVR
jgi:hypothetical protein